MVEKACKILNIELIFLPPYSPKFNPIEQVWRTIKNRLSTQYIENKDFLKAQFKEIYDQIIQKETFYNNWIEKFITT